MTNAMRVHSLLFVLAIGGAVALAQQPAVRAEIAPVAARKPAPAFRLADQSSKQVALSKFRGRVVLLNFWATECGGCKEELPYFIEFDRTFPSKQFEVVGVSMDIPYEDLKNAK